MIGLQHIYKSYDEKIVLEDVSLSVLPGQVIALIGENGAGKTTLLRIMMGAERPDRGMAIGQKEQIGYVAQELPQQGRVIDCFVGVEEWRVRYSLERVGLGELPLEQPIRELSGGQQTRLSFAVVLSKEVEPMFLLLDEPTNNLDEEALAWLKDFISSYKGGVVIASHDRAFLNEVATTTIVLLEGKLRQYGGNYDLYVEQRERERQTEQAQYEEFRQEKRRLQKLRVQKANQMQKVSDERFDKVKHESKMAFRGGVSGAQKLIGKNLKAISSRIDRLAEVNRPEKDIPYHPYIVGETVRAKKVLEVKTVSKVYANPVLRDISFEIRGAERLHIRGLNGSGKSTLLQIVSGRICPDSGEVELGVGVKVGYFSQDVHGLDMSISGLENLLSVTSDADAAHKRARSLGLLATDLAKKPSELSRGQQAKLGFTKLLLGDFHLLVLDEPTNHLDIPTRERIETALVEYGGALIVASHDTYFIEVIGVNRHLTL